MKYKLYKESKSSNDVTEAVLTNRGIPKEDVGTWINAGWPQINHWSKLGNMVVAVNEVFKAVKTDKRMIVIADSDMDGYSSAAIFINYLYTLYPEYVKNSLDYILHSDKQHGLFDLMDTLVNYDIVISPDGGSNDIEECKKLYHLRIPVIVLDHHEVEQDNPYCILVNSQLNNYPNNQLCGAGVTWQFCRAFDEIYAEEPHANDFVDICAFGLCSDMMLITSMETRAIINIGFKDVHNPFLYAMAQKNSFIMDKRGGNTYMGIAFGITPMGNAVIRSGTEEEKELIFKAFLSQYAFNTVLSSKRGHKGEQIPLYEKAVQIANSVKRRQTKLQDDAMSLLDKRIEEENLLDNSVIVLLCNPGEVEKNIAGLLANKYQAKYQRPCLVLTKSKTKDDNEYFYRGSMRNYSMSEIEDFKKLCEESNCCEWVRGHANAAGCSISENNIPEFIEYMNNIYSDISNEPVYWVDYIWNKDGNNNTILEIAAMKDYWGQGCSESMIAIEDISTSENNVQLMGLEKGHPTIKITLPSKIAVMIFGASQELYDKLIEPNAHITVVGTANANEWNGNVTAQIMTEDYEIYQKEEWVF